MNSKINTELINTIMASKGYSVSDLLKPDASSVPLHAKTLRRVLKKGTCQSSTRTNIADFLGMCDPAQLLAVNAVAYGDVIFKDSPTSPTMKTASLATPIADAGIGISNTVQRAMQLAHELRDKLSSLVDSKETDQFSIESRQLSLHAYEEGLSSVERVFFTTTLLKSAFWTRKDNPVVDTNLAMMQKIHDAGDCRRIILLSHPIEEEVEELIDRIVYLRRKGFKSEHKRLMDDTANLIRNIRKVCRAGAKVRVAHSNFSSGFSGEFRSAFKFDPLDCELAIYDDFRVDVFRGGRIGEITSVDVFPKGSKHFSDRLDIAKGCFSELWDSAKDGNEFLDLLESKLREVDTTIDGIKNWIASHHLDFYPNDAELKANEMKSVVEAIREFPIDRQAVRYLDVGSCTLRYPLALSNVFSAESELFGLDRDDDCVNFANNILRIAQQKGQIAPQRKVSITHGDICWKEHEFPFPNVHFDLVTCMLGTISYFGYDREVLETVFGRFYELLKVDGQLLFSNWTTVACDNHGKKLLDVFTPNDKEKLASWTPSDPQVREILNKVGFELLGVSGVGGRLSLYNCRKQTKSTARDRHAKLKQSNKAPTSIRA